MNNLKKQALLILLIFSFLFSHAIQVSAQSEEPITVVLFVSTDCPHCHNVLENTVKPLLIENKYNFQVVLINISIAGHNQFQNTIETLNIPAQLRGTPLLVIGDVYLVGDRQIPADLEKMLLEAQSKDNLLVPQVPDLKNIPVLLELPSVILLDHSNIDQLNNDGNLEEKQSFTFFWGWESIIISLTILLLSITFLIQIITLVRKNQIRFHYKKDTISLIYLILFLTGLSIAGYLSYSELFHKDVVCLGYSGCNTVQRSEYAYLFGFIPVAITGFFCYLVLTVLYLLNYLGVPSLQNIQKNIPIAVFSILAFNNIVLLGLNLLEFVVLRALCLWCWAFALTNILLTWIMIRNSRR